MFHIKEIPLHIYLNHNRNAYLFLVETQNDTTTLEESVVDSYQVHTLLPYDPAFTVLDINSNELKVYIKTYTEMFIVALFVIV